MIFGVDYNETFAPVAKMVTLRILLTLVAIYSLSTGSLDVKTAFLNAPIKEDVWLKPPKELLALLQALLKSTKDKNQRRELKRQIRGLQAGHLLKLQKAIYGTKQASREWYLLVDAFLRSMGFTSNVADTCFYSLSVGNDYVLILLYVDDIIVAATSEVLKMKYINSFRKRFKISYSGELREYLNILIIYDKINHKVELSQQIYIEQLLKQFTIMPDPLVTTPMQENLHLPLEEESNATRAQMAFVEKFPYRELIGVILYLNVCTRPDVSFAISYLAKFNSKPTFLACKALWRLAKYLYNTREVKLTLGGGANGPCQVAYSDSDWASCKVTRKSRTGCLVFLGNGPVAWYSKMQTIVALSSFEAEYIAYVPTIQLCSHVRKILKSINIPNVKFIYGVSIWSDNQAALATSKNPVNHQRSKHFHMKYAYIQEEVSRGAVVMGYTTSATNRADVCTKAVGLKIFQTHFPFIMGMGVIPKIEHKILTIEDDALPCPMCSCSLSHKK
jgi:hypothetical protein